MTRRELLFLATVPCAAQFTSSVRVVNVFVTVRNKKGELVFDPKVTIMADPWSTDAPANPWDGAGVPRKKHAIIDKGWSEGWVKPQPPAVKTGKKVAVVGAGAAIGRGTRIGPGAVIGAGRFRATPRSCQPPSGYSRARSRTSSSNRARTASVTDGLACSSARR